MMQCSTKKRDSTYHTLEALNMISRTKGPSERAVYGEFANRALSKKIRQAIVSDGGNIKEQRIVAHTTDSTADGTD
jgi:hypothetical protein